MIEVGCVDLRIAIGANAVGAQLVAEDEDDVWRLFAVCWHGCSVGGGRLFLLLDLCELVWWGDGGRSMGYGWLSCHAGPAGGDRRSACAYAVT